MNRTQKNDELIAEFTNCLNEQRYYDAHEALEEIWFPRRFEKDNEMMLLKGFINASVSFELVKRGRMPQSKRTWRNFLKYRPLLYKVQSEYSNEYHKIARHLEAISRNYHY